MQGFYSVTGPFGMRESCCDEALDAPLRTSVRGSYEYASHVLGIVVPITRSTTISRALWPYFRLITIYARFP
jgi:hypothetical protein